MLKIDDWEKAIERVTKEINNLEAMRSSYTCDIERLADKYKKRGDCYINLYLDNYVVHKTVNEEYANKSFKDYRGKRLVIFCDIVEKIGGIL